MEEAGHNSASSASTRRIGATGLPAGSGASGRSSRQWPLRLVGCLFGLGCWAVGLYTWLNADTFPDLEAGRALGFALVSLVVGVVAILGSLLAKDVRALWYCSPKRWRPFRNDVLDDR